MILLPPILPDNAPTPALFLLSYLFFLVVNRKGSVAFGVPAIRRYSHPRRDHSIHILWIDMVIG